MKIQLKKDALLALGLSVFVVGLQAGEKTCYAGAGARHLLRPGIIDETYKLASYGASLLDFALSQPDGKNIRAISARTGIAGAGFAGAGSVREDKRKHVLSKLVIPKGRCMCVDCVLGANASCPLDHPEILAIKRSQRLVLHTMGKEKLRLMQGFPRWEDDRPGAGLETHEEIYTYNLYPKEHTGGPFFGGRPRY
jgi:hypothetical protein